MAMSGNPRSSVTALETKLGQDGRGRERQAGERGFCPAGRVWGGGTPRNAEVTVFVVTFLFLAEAIGLDRTRQHPCGV